MAFKRWQNLIYRKCVFCDARLLKNPAQPLYACPQDEVSHFVITERKIVEILTDETHIMRRFLTQREMANLQQEIDEMQNVV